MYLPDGMDVLRSMRMIKEAEFPHLLQSLLNRRGYTKAELHDYLLDHNYEIEKTSMYRYFNANQKVTRMPDYNFMRLFSEFIGLSQTDAEILEELSLLKRQQK